MVSESLAAPHTHRAATINLCFPIAADPIDYDLMDSRTSAQAAASRQNGKQSNGPNSETGKATSSLNAVRHGLGARGPLLLPGESESDYEVFLNGWFDTIRPAAIPEASIVAELANLAWKIDRLNRVEHGHLMLRLEEEVMKTVAAELLTTSERAALAVRALLDAVRGSTPPASPDGLSSFLAGCTTVVEILRDVDGAPLQLTEQFAGAVDELDAAKAADEIASALGSIARAAQEATHWLDGVRENSLAELQSQREKLAAQMILMKDGDAKKFDRYRQMIEKAMQRQFELLKAAQEQTTLSKTRPVADQQELRVRLRLVR